jgi:DNA (cytosine-5)-methyltransferase 1
MTIYTCDNCEKTFTQKGHFDAHKARKTPCKKNKALEQIVEKKVNEVLCKINNVKIDENNLSEAKTSQMDYTKMSNDELKNLCKERNIRGYSTKNKIGLIALLSPAAAPIEENILIMEPPVESSKYKVLSLFSGMGGMDVGFAEQVIVRRESVQPDYIHSNYTISGFVNLKRLPFVTVFQNDILPAAQRVAELNGWDHNYTLKDIRDLLKEKHTFPVADVITGGFPCQDFSHAGKRQGFDAARGTLYQSYVELVKRVKPIVFVAENVNGLLTMPTNPINTIVADFAAAGYEVKYQLIKCEEHGIPQTRWRVIIMGIRLDKRPRLADDWNVITENKVRCTLRPYFAHLVEPADATDLAQKAYSLAARLEKGQGQSEVNLDGYGPTMRAEHHGNIEYRRIAGGQNGETTLPERRLTVREAALIQTFPPDCKLTEPNKKSGMAYKPIGNAVPPLLGYIVARKVEQILAKCA